MATTIKIKRGLKTNLPTLAVGEMGYCTDTNELFIGTDTGNVLINEGGQATETPTITEVDNTTGTTYTFTLTNNDDFPVTVRYELGSTPPLANEITLEPNETSDNIVLNVSELTSYTLYAQALTVGELKSQIVQAAFTTPAIPFVTLGVEWDQDTDSLTRLDDAVGLTAGSDFDGFNHYQLRRCMVNDDLSINYYIDPTNPNLIGEVVNTGTYTTGGTANYTGSHGQVMVEIPKFWWKTDEPTSDQYQWRISDAAQTGFTVHPAFITDGVTKDYIYMSAFEGNVSSSVMRSISGVKPSTDTNVSGGDIDNFRTYAQARGTGWQMQTYWGTHALQMLYLIEYADFDTQTTIGRGYVDAASGSANESINTGATISLGNASGAASGTDGLSAISYRGVENFWGNIWKFVDGINIQNNSNVYLANENFASNVYTGSYTLQATVPNNNVDNYVSDIDFPHFLATETSGSSTSHLHDYYYAPDDNQNIALFGGDWFRGSFAGGFLWRLSSGSSSAGRNLGSRLQIL